MRNNDISQELGEQPETKIIALYIIRHTTILCAYYCTQYQIKLTFIIFKPSVR